MISKLTGQALNKSILFESFKLGDITLKNRIIMAPLTRCRSDPKNVPNDLMKEYYTQRAGFGMIITECSPISNLSDAFPNAGGIYTQEQTQGWKKIVDAVHEKDGKICIQIWHAGRQVPDGMLPEGEAQAISSSAILMNNSPGYSVPREMTIEDIETLKKQFLQGAQNAKTAGFDAIELHGANGYIIDQFLRSYSNQRTDKYGGSVENRARLLLEVMEILIEVFGKQRVGVRLSPTGRFGDMYDENPLETYKYVLQELEKKDIAFVELKRHGMLDSKKSEDGKTDEFGRTLPNIQIPDFFAQLKAFYNGTIIGNDGLDPEEAVDRIQNKQFDLAAFGLLAINNPDLPLRIQNDWELNRQFDRTTFYNPASANKGYTDFPFYQQK